MYGCPLRKSLEDGKNFADDAGKMSHRIVGFIVLRVIGV